MQISARLEVFVEVTTRREKQPTDSFDRSAKITTVYGYWRRYKDAALVSLCGEGAIDLAGVVAYPLEPGGSVTSRERVFSLLRTDGHDAFFYQELCGSEIFCYRVRFEIASGFFPMRLEIGSRKGASPTATIQFVDGTCILELAASSGDPWLSDVTLIFQRMPQLADIFCKDDGMFAKATPF